MIEKAQAQAQIQAQAQCLYLKHHTQSQIRKG